MTPVDDQDGNVSTIFKTAMQYVDTRLDLFKLMLVDKASDGISSILSRIVAFLILFLAVVFLGVGLALCLGKWLGGIEYGFLAIGGLFVIVGIIFYAFKTPIIKAPVSSALIKNALK